MSQEKAIAGDARESKRRRYKGWMAWVVKVFSALIPLYSIFFVLNITALYFQTACPVVDRFR